MKILQAFLDLILLLDCIAAVVVTVFLILRINTILIDMPQYSRAKKLGKVSYKLGKVTEHELKIISRRKRIEISQEIAYEAYRQATFNKGLLKILAVNIPFTIVAALCCCFDGHTTENENIIGAFIAAAIVGGELLGIALNFVFAGIAYKNYIVKSNRYTGFVGLGGTLYRYGRHGDIVTLGIGLFAGWLVFATVCLGVYSAVVMFI